MSKSVKQKPTSVNQYRRRAGFDSQRGIGLIEVLIALVVLTVGALAVGNLQTASNVAIRNSADYFKLNELSYSIIEQLKADSVKANAGEYNTTFADVLASSSSSNEVGERVNAWKNTVAYILPMGEMQIACASSECLVSMRWYESSHTSSNEEVYNVRSPI